MVSQEFDEALRSIVQMDYGIVLISHATDKVFKDEQGQEYNKIVPTLDKRAKNIVSRMADIYGYARVVKMKDGNLQTRLFMRGTDRYEAGSRFRYTPDSIEFNYQSLVDALADAIEQESKEVGEANYTDERSNVFTNTAQELDFDALMMEFENIINRLVAKDEEKFKTYYTPRVTEIVEKYLGRGQKVSQCSRGQVEALSLIVDDLHELEK